MAQFFVNRVISVVFQRARFNVGGKLTGRHDEPLPRSPEVRGLR
jgi:hypothetical protein